MEDFITLYLENGDSELTNEQFRELSNHVQREIGIGSGYVNVYTRDAAITRKATQWLDSHNLTLSET